VHRNESALPQSRAAAILLEPERADQRSPSEVQFLAIVEEPDASFVEPVTATQADPERRPVGQVDQVLVLNHPARNVRTQAVISPRQVRAGIVHAVGH